MGYTPVAWFLSPLPTTFGGRLVVVLKLAMAIIGLAIAHFSYK